MPDPRVLLVEDDPDRALLAERALGQAPSDPSVATAETAEGAIEHLADPDLPRPDLVLLDLRLPGQDGFAVLERIGQDEGIPPVPVVVLTSSDEVEDMTKSYALGANGYVTKPVDFEEFREAIGCIARFWLEINLPPPEVSSL